MFFFFFLSFHAILIRRRSLFLFEFRTRTARARYGPSREMYRHNKRYREHYITSDDAISRATADKLNGRGLACVSSRRLVISCRVVVAERSFRFTVRKRLLGLTIIVFEIPTLMVCVRPATAALTVSEQLRVHVGLSTSRRCTLPCDIFYFCTRSLAVKKKK